MAGRYEGYHYVGDRGFEVFWQHQGWFWRPLCRLDADAVGPFTTSTQAYQHAAGAIGARPASREAS
jgi:hypothetical protein